MAFILTFLGKGGVGCTTMAITSAHHHASQGKKVLLAVQDSTPSFPLILGSELPDTVTEIKPNLHVIQLQSSKLLENSWEQVKELEQKYLKSPILNSIYGSELGILPGMDDALTLNYLREQDQNYDVIIYDSPSALQCLRMFGIPDILSWYIRRVRNILENSDIVKTISPFIQPVTSAVLNVSWSADNIASSAPVNEGNQMLDEGKNAINNPRRVAGFLVTNETKGAMETARYYWGSAQQVGLTIGGVLANGCDNVEDMKESFKPLNVTAIPKVAHWEEIGDILPNFLSLAILAPAPLTVDSSKREVKLFLPGFDKKQVKLSQSGPEITIEAGNQRRNILLPPPLKGQTVKGARFQEQYLIISL
ncbi:MAG: ArsA family ATPase [Cyanobacterium sp. T60_A2020_053]|nr:ArsA family ATPase [Cyanobacterium sp. T60_A2020_053]